MKNLMLLTLSAALLTACAAPTPSPPTATSIPTATAIPPTLTSTPTPTATPGPTATPTVVPTMTGQELHDTYRDILGISDDSGLWHEYTLILQRLKDADPKDFEPIIDDLNEVMQAFYDLEMPTPELYEINDLLVSSIMYLVTGAVLEQSGGVGIPYSAAEYYGFATEYHEAWSEAVENLQSER